MWSGWAVEVAAARGGLVGGEVSGCEVAAGAALVAGGREEVVHEGTFGLNADDFFALIERERIDVICFQEGADFDPAVAAYFRRGWYRDRSGFVISRG